MKLEHYFDIGCDRCGRHRSTDFEMGLGNSAKLTRLMGKAEGWRTIRGETVCPICAKQENDSNNTGGCGNG